MIKRIKIIVICSACCLITNGLNAQDFRADLLKISQKLSASSFKMDVKMSVYSWTGATPISTTTGVVKRKGDNYYTLFGGRINLLNASYNVLITEEDKNIIYIPLKNVENRKSRNQELAMLPDTSFYSNNVRLVKNTASGKTYEIKQPQLGITKMRLKISTSNTLKEVRYYYKKTDESPVKEVVITYNNMVFNPSFSGAEFSEKKYFNHVNGKEVLSSAYKDYTLVNGGY